MTWYKRSQVVPMTSRVLGKTGWTVPLFSLGGQSILESDNPDNFSKSITIIQDFLENGGKYIDTSPEYSSGNEARLSEKRISEAISGINRSSFYLATKTEKRTKDKAWEDINKSIETLGTEVDCLQIHHLDTIDEIDQIFSGSGVLRALKRAQDEGLTKFIGITGHSDPNVLLAALKKYPFDTVLGAFNAADIHMDKFSFQNKLILYCKKHQIGFISMKTCSRGALFENSLSSMAEALRYVWSFPISTTIVGVNNIEQLRRNMDIARTFQQPYLDDEKKEIEERTKALSKATMYFNNGGDEEEWENYERWSDTPVEVL